jgi:hypothetical protein
VRVRTKYRTFSSTTHNKNIHQLIDPPPKPCPLAFKSSDDVHKSHPTSSLMPSLASTAIEAVNLALKQKIASAAARRWGDGGLELLFG